MVEIPLIVGSEEKSHRLGTSPECDVACTPWVDR